jgi:hypothetical protein
LILNNVAFPSLGKIPVGSSIDITETASAESVDDLLDEGYKAVARLVTRGGDETVSMVVKANAFLASLSRIDDNRMMKCKPNKNKYLLETYSVCEREKMMGLPVGYVKGPGEWTSLCHSLFFLHCFIANKCDILPFISPVHKLFSELTTNAFINPETSDKGKTYREFLHRDFWHYRKRCLFKFQPYSEDPFFQLALSSPQEGKLQPSFYTEEQYCKHLVGNGWSVPVVEHILAQLKDLFADDVLLPYDKYTYSHPWEPYKSLCTTI